MSIVTSDAFDIYPIDKSNKVLYRNFNTLPKLIKKGKKMKNIKEEWEIDPKTGEGRFVHPAEAKQRKMDSIAAMKQRLADSGTKKINLDTAPRKVFKNDTEYTVQEIAKYCYEHSEQLQQRFDTREHFLEALKRDAKFRKNCNDKMVAKLGHKVAEKKVAKAVAKDDDLFKLAHKAFISNSLAIKKIVGKIESEATLRRMLAKDAELVKQLKGILGKSLNEEEENNNAQKLADFKVDCQKKLTIFKRILTKLENQVNNNTGDLEFVASCFDDFAEDVESEVEELKDTYEIY